MPARMLPHVGEEVRLTLDDDQRRQIILDYIAEHPRCHVREVISAMRPFMACHTAFRCLSRLEGDGSVCVDVIVTRGGRRTYELEVRR